MLRLLYRLAWMLILPLLPLKLWWRGRAESGYREAIGERFGWHTGAAREGVIWLHAVSLGETRAAQPLVKALRERFPDRPLLITSMTATGRAAARELYPQAIHAWLPYDVRFAVRRFLRHYRPALGVIMETELWPTLVRQCSRERVPLLLANARLSPKSARGYVRVASMAREMFAALPAIGAQSADDAERLRRLGAHDIVVTGNLKFDMPVPPDAEAKAATLRALFGPRRVLLAASTRDGEEALILDALARQPMSDALLVIVPRHPQRFDTVCGLLRARGLRHVRRSANEGVPAACPIVVGDSMGELAAYYRASDVAFIGGSLLPFGAQNLIEACAAGVPVLIGPSTFNFAEASTLAIEAGAAIQVPDADRMVSEAMRLLGNAQTRAAMGAQGRAFCAQHAGATARTLALCERLIEADRAA